MLFSFAFAFILAYFLNECTTRLATLIGSRNIASFLIVTFLSIAVLLLFSLAIPLLYNQLMLFSKGTPQFIVYLEESVKANSPQLHSFLEKNGISPLFEYVLSVIPTLSTKITQHLWSSTLAIANIVILALFTPMILFYLLSDWPKMVTSIREMVPVRYRDTFAGHMKLVDASISGYIVGQTKVSLTLGMLYTVLLFLIGMPYYFLIGISTGMLTVIPYFGTIMGFITAHLVALSHGYSILDVLPITLIFISCGVIESTYLSPRLLSKSVNLHPLWTIFSITVGGMSFGFVGVLLSVPVAAILAGFIRLGISCYKKSPYYRNETVDTH